MPDRELILCADKFGDVYGLPFNTVAAPDPDEKAPKPFSPVATNLTVHTGRNLQALESQRKTAAKGIKQRETIRIPYDLLLGHVSMLTDIAIASQTVNGRKRLHIITADRDEHIRLTRPPPQSHVIVGYCLGHTQFISKICVVGDVLVSGGGDDFLGVWDWSEGEMLCRIELRGNTEVRAVLDSMGLSDRLLSPIAVNGIWRMVDKSGSGVEEFLCTMEGIPALLRFMLRQEDRKCSYTAQCLPLQGNPLDVAVFSDHVIVSIDNAHQAGSLDQPRHDDSVSGDMISFAMRSR